MSLLQSVDPKIIVTIGHKIYVVATFATEMAFVYFWFSKFIVVFFLCSVVIKPVKIISRIFLNTCELLNSVVCVLCIDM